MADAGGATTTFEWDSLGRLVVHQPGGHDGGAPLRRARTAGRHRRRHGRRAPAGVRRRGSLVALVNGEGEVVRRAYDAAGRLVEEVDGAGRATTFERDAAGRLCRSPMRAGRPVRAGCGRARVVARGGAAVRSPGTGGPPPGGSLVVRPNGAVTVHRYDGAGRLESVAGPGSGRGGYERDAVGHVVAVVREGGGRTSIRRDPCGRAAVRTDPCGDTTRGPTTPRGGWRR